MQVTFRSSLHRLAACQESTRQAELSAREEAEKLAKDRKMWHETLNMKEASLLMAEKAAARARDRMKRANCSTKVEARSVVAEVEPLREAVLLASAALESANEAACEAEARLCN